MQRCLAPNVSRLIKVEAQDGWLSSLNMSRYYGMSNRERMGQWSLQLLRVYLCALESLRRAFALLSADVERGIFVPTYIVFLRNDALLACQMPVSTILQLQPREVLVPKHRWFEGINDQMAAMQMSSARHWAMRLDDLLVYRDHFADRRLVAEKTVLWALKLHGLTARPVFVPYYLLRPREMCDMRSCSVLDGGPFGSDSAWPPGLPSGKEVAARFARGGNRAGATAAF